MKVSDPQHVAALLALARANVDPDIQELLVYGNAMRGVAPGALAAAIAAALSLPVPTQEEG